VSGIADDDGRRRMVVGLALDADEREVWVFSERGDELFGGYQGSNAWEVLVEGDGDLRALGIGLEVLEERGRGKEGAGEGAVLDPC